MKWKAVTKRYSSVCVTPEWLLDTCIHSHSRVERVTKITDTHIYMYMNNCNFS